MLYACSDYHSFKPCLRHFTDLAEFFCCGKANFRVSLPWTPIPWHAGLQSSLRTAACFYTASNCHAAASRAQLSQQSYQPGQHRSSISHRGFVGWRRAARLCSRGHSSTIRSPSSSKAFALSQCPPKPVCPGLLQQQSRLLMHQRD